ncbi:hypothetical protein [Thioalkalicoccus limnaeus]
MSLTYLIALAMAASLALPVHAQPQTALAPDYPDPTAGAAMPAIPYISGGVGASEREELAQRKAQYNVHLLFAVAGSGEFLAGIPVQIEDGSGLTLLEATSEGPYFYARLAPGEYRITAERGGESQTKRIQVPATGVAAHSFYWQAR